MAISLEELAVGALEGSVGPWTLAVGASALAVALAAGSARPLRRIAATTVHAAERNGQIRLADWYGAARRGWHGLVAEARAEYEAGRRPGTILVTAAPTPDPVVPLTTVSGTVLMTTEPRDEAATHDADAGPHVRDRRGRFVRRSVNGTQPE